MRIPIVVVLVAALCVTAARAAEPVAAPAVPDAMPRAAIAARLADLHRIHAPEGVETLEPVPVNGTVQWVSIRGANRANPVLLFIHGGPGSPTMPTSWAFQRPLEDFFTVVQWDQRGVGLNAAGADREALAPTMTVAEHVADAEAVAEWLTHRLAVRKIVVVGHSWGTVVGVLLAARRPDLLSVYVGIGPAVPGSTRDSERAVYDETLARARELGDARAVRELEALAPYPGPEWTVDRAIAVRKWARAFDGGWYGKRDFRTYFALQYWAPEYSDEDLAAQVAATRWAQSALGPSIDSMPPGPTTFDVPMFFLQGRFDLHTPYSAAKRYFDVLTAPQKRLVTFERSAHFPMFEEPGRFLVAMIDLVRPLAGPPVEVVPGVRSVPGPDAAEPPARPRPSTPAASTR